MNQTPKQYVIELFGGVDEVATICGIDRTAPYHWKAFVPHRHQPLLLAEARRRGLHLPAEYFIAVPEAA